MKIISLILALFLCSCASIPEIDTSETVKKHVFNGCVIDAVNFQSRLNKDEIEFSRILNIFYYNHDGHKQGHTMCVFKDKLGKVYAWDIRGYFVIEGDISNPLDVARQVGLDNVYSAYYETERN